MKEDARTSGTAFKSQSFKLRSRLRLTHVGPRAVVEHMLLCGIRVPALFHDADDCLIAGQGPNM